MELTGEYRISASRQEVWDALNDVAVLKECIPGCQELEKTSDSEMSAVVVSKVGPVKATFKGSVKLENQNPPEGYSIVGEGKGGVAGFAKGGADVKLVEDDEDTILQYTANAQVGGKLAQLGSRLINSTAKKMADDFFGKFAAKFSPVGSETEVTEQTELQTHSNETDVESEEQSSGSSQVEEKTVNMTSQSMDAVDEGEKSLFDRYKTIIFWGLIVAAVLILLVLVIS